MGTFPPRQVIRYKSGFAGKVFLSLPLPNSQASSKLIGIYC